MPDSDEHYYITDLAKASFTEIWLASNRSPVALAVIGLMKLLRREVRSGMPMSLSVPDEIDVTSLPESVLSQLAEPLKELKTARFDAVSACRKQDVIGVEGYCIFLLSPDCLTICSLVWAKLKEANPTTTVGMISRQRSGDVLSTSNSAFGLKAPPGFEPVRVQHASAMEVFTRHQQRIKHLVDLVPNHRAQLPEIIESNRRRIMQFHIQRGFYIPATAEEISQARGTSD